MRRRATTRRWLFATCIVVATISCAGVRMKVPEAARSRPPWQLTGYSERSMGDGELTIGGALVHDVRRRAEPNEARNRRVQRAPQTLRFALRDHALELQAECTEAVEPYQIWWIRFGWGPVHFDCVCRAPRGVRAELSLVDGAGSLRQSDGTVYRVASVHRTARGRRRLAVLGYTFTGDQGMGALERTGTGRAFPPPSLDARAESELRCAYAALLLYRPEP